MNWIWLDEKIYPEFQSNFVNINAASREEKSGFKYCVAEFKKSVEFDKKIEKIDVMISADSFYHFYLNSEMLSVGPASAGGDFLSKEPLPKHYANAFTLSADASKADILVKVRLLPEVLTDFSRRHGGLACELVFNFEDGTKAELLTDETWLCRADNAYDGYRSYNSENVEDAWEKAVCIEDIWNVETAPIPILSLNRVLCESFEADGNTVKKFTLPKIYGAYPVLTSDGECRIRLVTRELEGQEELEESVVLNGSSEYFSFLQHSVGEVELFVQSNSKVNVRFELVAPWYPVGREGRFITNDDGLNKIYDVCKHTLKICRQSLHLDSTKHQELLACTGDYYIESLMTLFCFDDMRLAEFDIMRTADWLTANDGRMFHTTYSLIWVQMLRDVYMITGNIELLRYSRAAFNALFSRFDTYIGESGVIESPPDFMFVDWTVIDGYSMHHPPKALGQTVLNAFYYEALKRASEIYRFLGDGGKAAEFQKRAAEHRAAFNREFYDSGRGLYFDGKNDAHGDSKHFSPCNSDKRYFSKYPNILACAYGLTDDDNAVRILESIIFDDSLQDIQPYYAHYLLKALRRLGLFGKYGMKIIDRWRAVVDECDKGLAEGWIAPEPSYSFDHSHAWGGTPAYSLPLSISGMKILEPGMKKLSFSPCLYGLEFAEITVPSVYGDIELKINGDGYTVTVPNEIELVVNE